MNHNYFKNKTIWITGASSGIGKQMTIQLSDWGSKVIMSSRSQGKLNTIRNDLSSPHNAKVIPIDMESKESIDGCCQQILDDRLPDIVILNAGISQRSTVVDTDFATEERIIQTNFQGLTRCAKHMLKPMLDRGSGHLVIISSVTGKIGVPGRSSYAASKHALHGYFDSLRAEVEDHGIYVSIICPGYVFTNISANAVLGDGSPQNKIDENSRKGMEVSKFVKKALYGVSKKKKEMLIGGKETLGVYLKRFMPRLLFKIVKNSKP